MKKEEKTIIGLLVVVIVLGISSIYSISAVMEVDGRISHLEKEVLDIRIENNLLSQANDDNLALWELQTTLNQEILEILKEMIGE